MPRGSSFQTSMPTDHPLYNYLPDGISFISKEAAVLRLIYFPLCGTDSQALKSSITPFLSGDIKIDENHFLTKPFSREDLRGDVRNFFIKIDGQVLSLTSDSSEVEAHLEAGQLWHKVTRVFPKTGLKMSALNFVPTTGETVELMRVSVKNISDHPVTFTPTAVIPIFGRALSHKHDHKHVTSLFQRIQQLPEGVSVVPTMFFNEEGHSINDSGYYVFGISDQGEFPVGSFPTTETFYGEGGHSLCPAAVFKSRKLQLLEKERLEGKEAVGALRFKDEHLAPGGTREYFLIFGIQTPPAGSTVPAATGAPQQIFMRFNSREKFVEALSRNQAFWQKKSQAIKFKSADSDLNAWLRWVSIQPVLRRIFGNSFLPDHDYGKGGKGWRDLWQDLLSLILIEPEGVREDLIHHFAGVRIDGSNATIIGASVGEFIADRNSITRVWMDHGLWPFLTTALYIDQTGDYDILLEENPYFRDRQLSRTFQKDLAWTPAYGQKLKTKKGKIYTGTILEHILVQHLVQFFNVGEHNVIRLESADWNDGLDMAFARGESVAFMSLYGGNLLAIADLLLELSRQKGIQKIKLAKEFLILLDTLSSKTCRYQNVEEKKTLLFKKYFQAVQPEISGVKTDVDIQDLVSDLRKKGRWIFQQIRKKEWLSVQEGNQTFHWFNGYYDNEGKRVEGRKDGRIRMTLTGQVFPILSGLATDEEISEIIRSVSRFLKDQKLQGYRLNTDFGLDHYLSLGRAFGFAYGTKENGAFFSHMNVMYAYTLYKRGFVKEGREVLQSIYRMCMDTQKSKIYPGVPEYFDSLGRGMYHYLSGSASWFILTQLTQVFGLRGEGGDLILSPKLLKEEFDRESKASLQCSFAGKRIALTYLNENKLDYGEYQIKSLTLNDQPIDFKKVSSNTVKIKKEILEKLPSALRLRVVLA